MLSRSNLSHFVVNRGEDGLTAGEAALTRAEASLTENYTSIN